MQRHVSISPPFVNHQRVDYPAPAEPPAPMTVRICIPNPEELNTKDDTPDRTALALLAGATGLVG